MFTTCIWRQVRLRPITWHDDRNKALSVSKGAVKPGGKPATHAEHLRNPFSASLLARRIKKAIKVEGEGPA